jgi:hypothetical protein
MAYTPNVVVPSSSPSAVLDRTQAMVANIYSALSRAGETWWGAVRIRYRTIGNPTWTYIPSAVAYTATTPHYDPGTTYNLSQYSFAGNFFAAGDYEIQVEVQTVVSGSPQDSGYSASSYFSMGTPPAAPTITSPTNGSTVDENINVTIGHATGQSSMQVQVLDGAAVQYDSGEQPSAGTGTTSSTLNFVPFAVTGVSRTVRARTKSSGGIWSGWASVSVNVVFTPPLVANLNYVRGVDHAGVGYKHALLISTSNTGTSPATVRFAVYVRELGSSDPVGEYVGEVPKIHTHMLIRYNGPRAGSWQVRLVAYSALGATSTTAWTTATTSAIPDILGPYKGVLLHDPAEVAGSQSGGVLASTTLNMLLNDKEATEDREVETALVPYAGREFPVAEFGEGGSQVYTVPLIHSEGLSSGSPQEDVNVASNGVPRVDLTDWSVGGGTVTRTQVNGVWYANVPINISWCYGQGIGVAGRFYAGRFTVRGTPGTFYNVSVTDNVAFGIWCVPADGISTRQIPASGVDVVEMKSAAAAGGPSLMLGIAFNTAVVQMGEVMVMEVGGVGQSIPTTYYWDGSSADDSEYTYDWAGVSQTSASIRTLKGHVIDRLRALIERRTVLCYRDRRGRRVYGVVRMDTIKDTHYGQTTGLEIARTYLETAPPSDLVTWPDP